MNRPLLLDLFCGAGGAAVGYARAGFDVVGVDLRPQPHFPYRFIQADALTFDLAGYDAIHASPPCQRFSRARLVGPARKVKPLPPDLIDPIRRRLLASGRPFVIENVEGAPLLGAVKVCGSSFGLRVRRHRFFESNVPLTTLACRHKEQGKPIGVYHVMGDTVQGRCSETGKWVVGGTTAGTLKEASAAMGIDWMTWNELKESIPPTYTEHLGRQILDAVLARS